MLGILIARGIVILIAALMTGYSFGWFGVPVGLIAMLLVVFGLAWVYARRDRGEAERRG